MHLSQAEYNALIREYDSDRFRALSDADTRKALLYERFPSLPALDRKLVENAAARARAKISGRAEELDALNKESARLRLEKEEFYHTHNIPADYLDVRYNCPDCRDTGFIDARRCHCFTKKIIRILYRKSGIETVLQSENFGTLDMDYYDQDIRVGSKPLSVYMHEKVAFCRQFAADFDSAGGSLFFYGPTGTGKTFLTNCITKELIDSCHSVLYFSCTDLINRFTYGRFTAEGESFQQDLLACDLLVIDDLGTETVNAFTETKIFYCINERLIRSKSTLISTNLNMNQLKNIYSERIYSRIASGFTLIRLDGEDIRIRKKFGHK